MNKKYLEFWIDIVLLDNDIFEGLCNVKYVTNEGSAFLKKKINLRLSKYRKFMKSEGIK